MERLRPLYAETNRVLIRFVLDAVWLKKQPPHRVHEDMIGVPMTQRSHRHCAHKMVGWWKAAGQWPARFYGKTDDDAVVDLPRLVPLLDSTLPSTGAYAGIVRYSSLNESTLEGECWAPGAGGALKLHQRRCPGTYGPFPFVEGPLVVLTGDVRSWVAPRLAIDDRQRCHFEDLLLGHELSKHPRVHLVNLERILGRILVVEGRREGGGWVGPQGLLAHWTRNAELFWRTVATFRQLAVKRCADGPPVLPIECAPWRASYPDIHAFPCCHDWALCLPPSTRRARLRRGRMARTSLANAHPARR